MPDIFEETIRQLNEMANSTSKKVGFFFKKAVNKGEEYAVKGKVQIEIEKLKWDLRQCYIELGKYISVRNREAGVMDFSHDDQYILLLDKIENQRKYISERSKNMSALESSDVDD